MDEHEFLFGRPTARLDERREVKVRIPVAYLIKLHGIKLLNGQGISETVTAALARYFKEAEAQRAEAHAVAAHDDA